MKTPIEIRPGPCPCQARRRLACKILRPYVAPLSNSSRTDIKTQLAYLVDTENNCTVMLYHQRTHALTNHVFITTLFCAFEGFCYVNY